MGRLKVRTNLHRENDQAELQVLSGKGAMNILTPVSNISKQWQIFGRLTVLFLYSYYNLSVRSSAAMAMFGKVLEPVGYMQTVR